MYGYIGQGTKFYNPLFSSNNLRVKNRQALDAVILNVTESLTHAEMIALLRKADVAYGSINDVSTLSRHPALQRRVGRSSSGETVSHPARPIQVVDADEGPVLSTPEVGEHSQMIRSEFA